MSGFPPSRRAPCTDTPRTRTPHAVHKCSRIDDTIPRVHLWLFFSSSGNGMRQPHARPRQLRVEGLPMHAIIAIPLRTRPWSSVACPLLVSSKSAGRTLSSALNLWGKIPKLCHPDTSSSAAPRDPARAAHSFLARPDPCDPATLPTLRPMRPGAPAQPANYT